MAKVAEADAAEVAKYSMNARVSDWNLAEQVRNTHELFVDDATPPELVERGAYYSLMSEKLNARDLLYVQPKSGRWLKILRVIFVDRGVRGVQVTCLGSYELPAPHVVVRSAFPRVTEELRFPLLPPQFLRLKMTLLKFHAVHTKDQKRWTTEELMCRTFVWGLRSTKILATGSSGSRHRAASTALWKPDRNLQRNNRVDGEFLRIPLNQTKQ